MATPPNRVPGSATSAFTKVSTFGVTDINSRRTPRQLIPRDPLTSVTSGLAYYICDNRPNEEAQQRPSLPDLYPSGSQEYYGLPPEDSSSLSNDTGNWPPLLTGSKRSSTVPADGRVEAQSSTPPKDAEPENTRLAARRHEARSRRLVMEAEEKLRLAVFRRFPQLPDRKHRVFEAAADLLSTEAEDLKNLHEINHGLIWETERLRAEITRLQQQISQMQEAHDNQSRLLAFVSQQQQPAWQISQQAPFQHQNMFYPELSNDSTTPFLNNANGGANDWYQYGDRS